LRLLSEQDYMRNGSCVCVRVHSCVCVCVVHMCVMSVSALVVCMTVQAPLLSRALTKRKHADDAGGKQQLAITRQANGDGSSDAPCSGRPLRRRSTFHRFLR
jgi:hypothetical protein